MKDVTKLVVPAAGAVEPAPAVRGAPAPEIQDGRRPKLPPFLTTSRLVSLVVVVVVSTLSAYFSSNAQRNEYGAEVKMRVDTGGRDSDSILPAMATQKVILRSDAVLRPAAAEAGVSLKELEESVTVGTVGESEVLRLLVVDHRPDRARRTAQVVADTYIKTVAATLPTEDDETVAFLRSQSEQLAATLAEVRARQAALETSRVAGTPPTAEESQLEVEASVLLRRIGAVEERITSREVDAPTVDVRALSEARVLDEPVSPKPVRSALGGFVVGLLLAAAALAVMWWR